MPLVSFSSGQVIKSADVNSNFGLCVLTDTSRTITVTHTYTATQTFSGGFTTGANASVTGTFGVSGLLTASAGIGLTGSLTLATAISKIVPGATSLSLRNNADSADNLIVTDAGAVTVRASLAITGAASYILGPSAAKFALLNNASVNYLYTATGGLKWNNAADSATRMTLGDTGGLTLHFGSFTLGDTASKIVPGATSLSHRNNADSLDNLLITDAGAVTARASLAAPTVTTSSGSISAWTQFEIQGTKVVSSRVTGYTNAWTGTAANRATSYDAASITTAQLAARVRALQNDMEAHGLIGV